MEKPPDRSHPPKLETRHGGRAALRATTAKAMRSAPVLQHEPGILSPLEASEGFFGP
jgi:hypothetical protein